MQAVKQTGKTLEELLERADFGVPKMQWWFHDAVVAWNYLHRFRQTGFGIGPIALQDIWTYCLMKQVPLQGRLILAHQIAVIDEEYRVFQAQIQGK